MRLRGLDIHAHVRTGERRQIAATHRDAERLFGGADLRDADPIEFYRDRGLMAVVFDVDTETTTGERMSNDEIAAVVQHSDGTLIGFATVDPWKGRAAIRELERCAEMGFCGLKLQTITQAFWLNDRRFRPLWDACQSLGLPVLIHMGTTAIGAGSPGGRGFQLKYGQPIPALDDVAAAFPSLNLIAAHFAWPWHLELLAVARHKGNVYVDLSGWAPKYIPPEVIRYCNSVIPEKFLFGTDFPLFNPDRWLAEFEELEIKDDVRTKVMFENACRLLGIDASRFAAAAVKH